MERVIRFDNKPWDMSVYTAMRETLAAACFRRVLSFGAAIADGEEGMLTLPGGFGYDAEDGFTDLTPGQLYDRVSERFVREAHWVTSREENLLKLLLIGEGAIPFVPQMASEAEGLLKRGWCLIERSGTDLLRLRGSLIKPLTEVFQSPAFQITSRMVSRLEAIVYSIVFIYGYANLRFTANLIQDAVTQTGLQMDITAMRHLVKGYMDYYRRNGRDEYLVHPALRDPDALISQSLNFWDGSMSISIQDMQGGIKACLPKEREAVEAANLCFSAISRNEPEMAHLSENIYYMFKQGATLREVRDYITPKLIVTGTVSLRRTLETLFRDIVPWGQAKEGAAN